MMRLAFGSPSGGGERRRAERRRQAATLSLDLKGRRGSCPFINAMKPTFSLSVPLSQSRDDLSLCRTQTSCDAEITCPVDTQRLKNLSPLPSCSLVDAPNPIKPTMFADANRPKASAPTGAAAAASAATTTTTTTTAAAAIAYRPAQLSAAAGELSALLARGQATLDAVAARLEAEFSERFSSSSSSGKAAADPCELARRVRRLERELPLLKQEAEAAALARRALAERAAETLGGGRARLHALSARSGLMPPRDQREGNAFAAAVWAAGEAAAATAAATAAVTATAAAAAARR
jgi:hypothetical protein